MCNIRNIQNIRVDNPNADPVEYEVIIQKTEATFQIHNVKLYVLVVMLSINNNIKLLENIKQGFKRTIS